MRDPELEDILARRGTVTRIAAALGISPAAVSQWQRVPAERVAELSRLLDLPQDQLRVPIERRPCCRRRHPALGPHEELLETSPLYRELAATQLLV